MGDRRSTTPESIVHERRYEAHGCFDAMFAGSVSILSLKGYLDISVIHGDGTSTVANKGGDNLG